MIISARALIRLYLRRMIALPSRDTAGIPNCARVSTSMAMRMPQVRQLIIFTTPHQLLLFTFLAHDGAMRYIAS